jgi:hypothetical protein
MPLRYTSPSDCAGPLDIIERAGGVDALAPARGV